jgi:hypothetical protein
MNQIKEKEICNYRINLYFTGPGLKYWRDFHKNRRHYALISSIFAHLEERGVEHKWFFFEPYVEITWLEHKDRGPTTLEDLVKCLEDNNFTQRTKKHRDEGLIYNNTYDTMSSLNGLNFCEWFDKGHMEKFFGALRYAATAQVALALYETGKAVDEGKGINAQYMRSLHSLANQMGLNYRQEGWYAIKRGIFCLLIWATKWFFPEKTMGGYKTARFIYRKIFRQKDLA